MTEEEHTALVGGHSTAFVRHLAGREFKKTNTYRSGLTESLEDPEPCSSLLASAWCVRSVYWHTGANAYCAIDEETAEEHTVPMYTMEFDGFSWEHDQAMDGDQPVLGRQDRLQTIDNIHRWCQKYHDRRQVQERTED